MTSSRKTCLNIRKNVSPKYGQDNVSGGVSVLCWLAVPVADVNGNRLEFGNKTNSKSVIWSSSVTNARISEMSDHYRVSLYMRLRCPNVKLLVGPYVGPGVACNIWKRGTTYCLMRSP